MHTQAMSHSARCVYVRVMLNDLPPVLVSGALLA